MLRSDDIASLFISPPDSPRATALAASAEQMRYRQGTILAWNPATLENTVHVAGAEFVNLPVLGVAEAASYAVGTVVGVAVVGSTWAIIGRFVVPGTQGATDALSNLASKTQTASVPTDEAVGAAVGFQDLATLGPEVVVTVGASGKLLVLLSCFTGTEATDEQNGGLMAFDLTGANTLAAGSIGWIEVTALLTAGSGDSVRVTTSGQFLVEGLTPGDTVVTAKYAYQISPGVFFRDRVITASAL